MQQAFLSQLKEGDRFYFPKNKSEVCEFLKKKRESLRGEYDYFWLNSKKEGSSKKDLLVIYLRNTNS